MNGTLLVTFNYSGYPMVRELKQRIADGELGQIRQVMVEMPQEGFLRHVKSGRCRVRRTGASMTA